MASPAWCGPGRRDWTLCRYLRHGRLGDGVFSNPWGFIKDLYQLTQERQVVPEFELFDLGHVATLHRLLVESARPPVGHVHCDLVMGVPGGMPGDVPTLAAARPRCRCATWSATGIGRSTLPVLFGALGAGGHLRVGMEDTLSFARGRPVTRNAELVERAAELAGFAQRPPMVRPRPVPSSASRTAGPERGPPGPAPPLARVFAIASTSWHTEGMRNETVKSIGDYIREQREQARISMRQLAQQAGVSNPYLSQIERGLRKPSADILQQIAKGLRISAEALYVQAGILEDRPADSGVRSALLADPELSERQKQVLIEIYESFRKENAAAAARPRPPRRRSARGRRQAAAETKASKSSGQHATDAAAQDERSGDAEDVSGQTIPSD